VQIRRLKEQAAPDRHVARLKVVQDERISWRTLLFIERSVAGMENRPRDDFVHCQEVCKQPVLRAVELFEKPQAEMFVELVRGLGVHDGNGVYPLSVGCAIEPRRAVVDVLLKMLVRLKRESKGVVL